MNSAYYIDSIRGTKEQAFLSE